MVGFLDGERAAGSEWSAAEFNASAVAYYAQHGLTGALVVSDLDLASIRERRRELFSRWAALPAGETLELRFGGTAGSE
jgi:hypothetical protein